MLLVGAGAVPAFVDSAVGYGRKVLARSSWRSNWPNRVRQDMQASARRDCQVQAVASLNDDVVLVIVGMRPGWNHGSALASWWV